MKKLLISHQYSFLIILFCFLFGTQECHSQNAKVGDQVIIEFKNTRRTSAIITAIKENTIIAYIDGKLENIPKSSIYRIYDNFESYNSYKVQNSSAPTLFPTSMSNKEDNHYLKSHQILGLQIGYGLTSEFTLNLATEFGNYIFNDFDSPSLAAGLTYSEKISEYVYQGTFVMYMNYNGSSSGLVGFPATFGILEKNATISPIFLYDGTLSYGANVSSIFYINDRLSFNIDGTYLKDNKSFQFVIGHFENRYRKGHSVSLGVVYAEGFSPYFGLLVPFGKWNN